MIKILHKSNNICWLLFLIFALVIGVGERAFASNEDSINKFPKSYPYDARKELFECGVSPALVEEYGTRYWSTMICKFHYSGMSPKQVNGYPERMNGDVIYDIIQAGVSAKEIKKFPRGIKDWTIVRLAEKGTFENETTSGLRNYYKIEKRHRRFSNDDAAYLLAFGIDFKVALSYPKYSGREDIRWFVEGNVSPKTVEEYSAAKNKKGKSRFGADIVTLVKANISLKEAIKYPEGVYGGAYDISQFVAHGISPETVASYSTYKFPDDLDMAFYGQKIILLEEAKKK